MIYMICNACHMKNRNKFYSPANEFYTLVVDCVPRRKGLEPKCLYEHHEAMKPTAITEL